MEKQLIISLGREYGSGGHDIAEDLAKRFGLPLYDSNLLEEIARNNSVDHDELKKYDERPRMSFFTRKVRGHSNSLEETIAYMQFEYMKKMAERGDSFVIVGRCAEVKLKEFPCLVSIFVLADAEAKIERIMKKFDLTREAAKAQIKKENYNRKAYHNFHCPVKWGDSRNYELSINSSKLGYEATTDMIEAYVRKRYENM